jgi:glycosyltransferase involved in cell wall biosynthesis
MHAPEIGEPEAKPTVTILVPAYNESDHIQKNLGLLRDHMVGLSSAYDWEILVVDDGSSDNTGAQVEEFAAENERVRLKSHRTNLGLGRALTTGFRWTKADYIVTCDADLSYSPDHVSALLDTIVTTGSSIVIASPYMRGGTVTGVPAFRALLSRWANRFLGRMSMRRLSTVTGMVRAYDGHFIRSMTVKALGPQVNSEIIYKAQVLRAPVVEIPAHLHWTRDETDTARRKLHFNMLRTIIDFSFAGFIFRPFFFFMLPGVIILLGAAYAIGNSIYHVVTAWAAGSGAFDDRLTESFATAFARSPHSFVVGGIGLIVAVQLISLGLLSAQNKRYFEDGYNLAAAIHGSRQSAQSRDSI